MCSQAFGQRALGVSDVPVKELCSVAETFRCSSSGDPRTTGSPTKSLVSWP